MVKVLHLEVKVKVSFVRRKKKKRLVQGSGSLAWNIYLMDLIEKKSRKSISRMQN